MIHSLARLVRMRPNELRTRVQQALSKRLGRPAPCRLQPVTGPAPVFFDLPAAPPDLIAKADRICAHRFDLLGYEALDFGTPIDWHLDPVHHKQAPRKPWYQIPFLDFAAIGDHKIIWELNRHQHLVILAQAWRETQDDRYATEIRVQWRHWQQENPYPVGINWASSLEVAFRALSWLWVAHLLGDLPEDWLQAFYLHGWHIERYLSTYFSPNTHLLGEGMTLFALGVLCPQIPAASRWRGRGWRIILRQAETQVRDDGFHFEQSVYYHVYALEFFEQARLLAVRGDIPVPPAFDRTIKKMSEALSAISQAGAPPRFGDDDGGRLIGNFAPVRVCAPHSVALESSGIYAMTAGRAQFFIDAGPMGVFAGGHGHADALSVQLVMDGRLVLIDPGTFCYVCPERNRFRGTAAHNTLEVDGCDQATPAGPFAWTGMPETTVDRWHSAVKFDFFAGHHNGYAPVIHHRQIFALKAKFWLVRDVADGPGRHTLALHWHYLNANDISILPPAAHTWTQTSEPWDWSPVYGRKSPAYVLRFSTVAELPAEFAVLLLPSANPGIFTQTAPGAYRYEDAEGTHEFTFTSSHFSYRHNAEEIFL